MDRCLSRALTSALALSCVLAGLAAAAPARPSVILLTLDTTRADALGAARGAPTTPNLDALAARGVRFLHALSPAPLTLPAHASLLTGLEPRSHGIRDNGTAALPADLPTLATAFAAAGYRTGAFVASRVLDRRFGLARGFDVYDDRMAAERVGEYGYPERDAAAVTGAALAWARGLPRGAPFFLWVHYYDPHSPYQPPADLRGDGSAAARYAGEVALMDREIGRLLAGLPREPAPLVAAVGDHGEALGEHGERAHGVLLHGATLEVPLLIAGPGVPAGTVVTETVGIRRLAVTLLSLAGVESVPALPGTPLPLGLRGRTPTPGPVLSETHFPANAYGWSPLRALTDGSWRLVVGARAELFDLAADPRESTDLLGRRSDIARKLKRALAAAERASPERAAPAPAPAADRGELDAALRSLGYLGGSAPGGRGAAIDPRDGVAMLEEFEAAKAARAGGDCARARDTLRELVRRSPGNVPFLGQLAAAHLACKEGERAVAAHQAAIRLSPRNEFLHVNLADTYRALGRLEEARRELEVVVRLDPRSAPGWIRLAELAGADAHAVLRRAVAAETDSAMLWTELGKLELRAGERAAAGAAFLEATRIEPEWGAGWRLRGELDEFEGRLALARERYLRAIGLDPTDAIALLRLGVVTARLGDPALARGYLQRAAAVAPGTAVAADARRALAELD